MSALGKRWTTTKMAKRLDQLRSWLAERYEPATIDECAAVLGVTKRTARRLLYRLEDAGDAARCGGGLWA